MRKRVSRKVFRVSLLACFLATSILSSHPNQHSATNENDRIEHIWSITDDSQDFARDNIQEVVKQKRPFAKSSEGIFLNGAEALDWEGGWERDLDAPDPFDVNTFFPISDENELKLPEQPPVEEALPGKALTPAKQPRPPQHLFSLHSDEEAAKKGTQSLDEPFSLPEFDQESWPKEKFESRLSGDISTAQQKSTSLYAPVQEKKAVPKIDLDLITNDEVESPFELEESQSPAIGKKRVSVAPFASLFDSKSQEQEPRQMLFSKKAPYVKPVSSKGNQKAIGPFYPENASSSNKVKQHLSDHGKTQEKVSAKNTQEMLVAQLEEGIPAPADVGQGKTPPKTILISFNNVSIIEYIRFISRITNRNFIFDEADLQFNVTIISEEPTTLENVMTALIQTLRIHGLALIEEGNNLIIHRNNDVRGISRVNVEGSTKDLPRDTELITQVFRLNTLGPEQARSILRPLLSKQALIEVALETRHLIITDLVANIQKIDTLLKSIDAPNSGLVIGQYVVRNAFMDNLIDLAKQIMEPIAQDQILTFVPHPAAKSIFIVSSPFIVERTISVLQHLDNFQGVTRIYDLEDLKFQQIVPTPRPPGVAPEVKPPVGIPPEGVITPTPEEPIPSEITPQLRRPQLAPSGKWELSPEGAWIFRPGFPPEKKFTPGELPQGEWVLDPQGNWYFLPQGVRTPFPQRGVPPGAVGLPEIPGLAPRVPAAPALAPPALLLPGETPRGHWVLDPQGAWIFQLSPGEKITPERLSRISRLEEELPVGHIERTKFYIHKLQYRRGDDIVDALQRIGDSLQFLGSANTDLISTIQSTQWLEASNSLVITGTDIAIEKVKELIEEIDRPLRQVLIDMLILETTIDDSLTYGVSWGTRSGGGNTSTAQAFIGGAAPLVGALNTAGVGLIPSAATLATTVGYNLGIVGQRLTHNGTQFASIGALVNALHTQSRSNIILNPKIITEDNKTAEIFVGINSPFLSNSVANDEGSIITTNVEFRDTGTTLRVTPLIGHSDIITLEIEQEVSRTQGQGITGGGQVTTVNLTPTTSVNRTTTTVHIPDKHFVIISGMIQEEQITNLTQFPCLGSIPILGAAFKNEDMTDAKRNLMVFIRPQIIDTGEEYTEITRRNQGIWKQKNRFKKMWRYEVDEALDFMNIKPPCCEECEPEY